MKLSKNDLNLITGRLQDICVLSGRPEKSALSSEAFYEFLRLRFCVELAGSLLKFECRHSESIPVELFQDLSTYVIDAAPAPSGIEFSDELLSKLFSENKLEQACNLSSLYGTLLEYRIALGENPRIVKGKFKRKRSGSFYTPGILAEKLVVKAVSHMVLQEADSFLKRKIVDPACGPGIFLVAFHKALVKNWPDSSIPDSIETHICANMLYGVDLDPASVFLTRFNLWLLSGCKAACQIGAHIKVGNSLIGISDTSLSKEEQDQKCAEWFKADADQMRFFHWRSEFPEVFQKSGPKPGFDVVVGNPPWEISKVNSREFFAQYDRNYFSYGKQKALSVQKKLFERNPQVLDKWNKVVGSQKQFMRWLKEGPGQFDSASRGFQFLGKGDANLYKCFVEQSYHLAKPSGLITLIVPAGIYCDSGSKQLRNLLLESCNLLELAGFENQDQTFPIHRSFKYCYFMAEKGGATRDIKTSFLNLSGNRSDDSKYSIESVNKFSPRNRVILEVENQRCLELIEKIFDSSQYLADAKIGGLKLNYSREFDMTLDSGLFLQRDKLESSGCLPDLFSNWIEGNWKPVESGCSLNDDQLLSSDGRKYIELSDVQNVYVPLYEGRMVGQFDYSKKHWLSGKGRAAVWQDSATSDVRPQYLVHLDNYLSPKVVHGLKTGFLAVGSDTNKRSMIAACLNEVACGNAVPVFYFKEQLNKSLVEAQLVFTAILNSFVFDFVLRRRMAGTNLNYFIVEECPLPDHIDLDSRLTGTIARLAAELNITGARFQGLRSILEMNHSFITTRITGRIIRALLDTLVLDLYDLDLKDLAFILEGSNLIDRLDQSRSFSIDDRFDEINSFFCGIAEEILKRRHFHLGCVADLVITDHTSVSTSKVNPKGFWRVDQNDPFIQRQTNLAMLLSVVKCEIGLDAFLDLIDEWLFIHRGAEDNRKYSDVLQRLIYGSSLKCH